MANSSAPAPGHRISRWVIQVLLLAAALLAIATPALAATHATHGTQAAASTAAPASTATPVTPARLTASITPARAGPPSSAAWPPSRDSARPAAT